MDCSVAHASVYARTLSCRVLLVCAYHIMEFVAASRFVGKALISRYDSPNERPTGFAKPAGVTSPNGSPIGSLDITGGTQYASGWGSKGNSAERAKLAPGMIRPDWNPQPQPVAELKPSFWSNLNPKPSDNQNPFEPLTTVFAAKRDSMGSPPQDFGAMRGGWPAGGRTTGGAGSRLDSRPLAGDDRKRRRDTFAGLCISTAIQVAESCDACHCSRAGLPPTHAIKHAILPLCTHSARQSAHRFR